MKMQIFQIDKIPSVLYGEQADKVIVAVHGNQSSKTDVPVRILAETASEKGYQVLSFDLPEHGERKEEGIPNQGAELCGRTESNPGICQRKMEHSGIICLQFGRVFQSPSL